MTRVRRTPGDVGRSDVSGGAPDGVTAFLGAGLLGSGFVEAAAGRGENVVVWNRTAERARVLERFGVRVAETPADAARGARRVHLVLSDDAVVEEVLDAARPGIGADALVIDHTTTQPKQTAARARQLTAAGVRYLHCPVFIGPAAAREGKGTIMSSGPRDLFDDAAPALERMGACCRRRGWRWARAVRV
jgi:3-hydroxyisobutyrate dehydrogenase-like beta-hydroxyacid dehydrogenase